jgi:hypothetical protein
MGNRKALLKRLLSQQLGAWCELQQLLTANWAEFFEPWEEKFQEIERRLKRQRDYLAAKFEALKADLAKLKAQGIDIETCDLCHFKAAQVIPEIGDLDEAICLVCDHRKHWLNFSCPRCKKNIPTGGWWRVQVPKMQTEIGRERPHQDVRQNHSHERQLF